MRVIKYSNVVFPRENCNISFFFRTSPFKNRSNLTETEKCRTKRWEEETLKIASGENEICERFARIVERGRGTRMTRFWIPKKELVTRWSTAVFPTLLYVCIIYRWRNERYAFGTVLIDEETITAYREQDASLVMICVICRGRRTDTLPKRWWNATEWYIKWKLIDRQESGVWKSFGETGVVFFILTFC